jgi:hypothetical protein
MMSVDTGKRNAAMFRWIEIARSNYITNNSNAECKREVSLVRGRKCYTPFILLAFSGLVFNLCPTRTNNKQDRQCMFNVTLSRVRATIVAVANNVYYTT